jgi:hypothetical protein
LVPQEGRSSSRLFSTSAASGILTDSAGGAADAAAAEEGAAAGAHATAATVAAPSPQHLQEVSDTLKVAACLRRFRSRGHLVSQLDPLQRTPGGPWLGPIGDNYSKCAHPLHLLRWWHCSALHFGGPRRAVTPHLTPPPLPPPPPKHNLCRSDASLMRLVREYPKSASAAERCVFLAAHLGLEGPSDPARLFALGSCMPRECCSAWQP